MMTSDDKVGGWVKKGQNHDDVILECPLIVKTAADKDLSNNLKSIMLILGFILENWKKSPGGTVVEKSWKDLLK